MKKLALFVLIAVQILCAEPSVLTDPAVPASQEAPSENGTNGAANDSSEIGNLFSGVGTSVSATLSSVPERAYVGEIIPVTVRLTPVDAASGNIEYTLQNESGVRIFSDTPRRKVESDAVYDTFYFLVQSTSFRLPDITATLSSTGSSSETLSGKSLSATPLNPPSGFANILAERFEIVNYKTTPYDSENNVIIFTAKASRCNIGTFSVPNAVKQGFETKLSNVGESQITYYVIVPNTEQNLNFSYFNLKKQRYESILIPVIVDDDTVSTQSDLSPTDERHTELKVAAALVTIAILFALFYWRREKWYLYVAALPMFYLLLVFLPNKTICVKKDAPIYLLPINHGTVFEMTPDEEHLEGEKEVGEFTKVKLEEGHVGWVHKRDFCSN